MFSRELQNDAYQNLFASLEVILLSCDKYLVYIYIYTLLVCLFVCIQLTSKRLNRTGPNFV